MRFLYSISIRLYAVLIKVAALFNNRARLFSQGQRTVWQELSEKLTGIENPIWFHFASLGEFEQGRSVLEAIKGKYPEEQIVITFFSPSGYQVRKDTALADAVFYLPLDTQKNAEKFLKQVNPKFAIFTKYEFWYHYFNELNRRDIPLFLISAIFRGDQIFFKPWGGFFRRILFHVDYFFVQNKDSESLLRQIGIKRVGLSGDTRFDRVKRLREQNTPIPLIESFVKDALVLVAGSSWAPDEKVLREMIADDTAWKLVIAPHEVDAQRISQVKSYFNDAVLYSELKDAKEIHSRVLIIDSIGILSSLYRLSDVSYVGGGFGVGIHNTLEAATYGKPVVFGPNYYKFQEAKDLIEEGAAFSIETAGELQEVLKELKNRPKYERAALSAKEYVDNKAGATAVILKYLEMNQLL